MADTKVGLPFPGTPLDDPAWQQFFLEIWERTGGDLDSVNTANETATEGVSKADSAQSTADGAVTSIGSLQTSVADQISEVRFITGAI